MELMLFVSNKLFNVTRKYETEIKEPIILKL